MLIANPVYDTVIKWLLDNNRIARYFIETILGEPVTDVRAQKTELFTSGNKNDNLYNRALGIIMLDFVATVRVADGSHKKVLIEIQNSQNAADTWRFRKYLAGHYQMKDVLFSENGIQQQVTLPVVPIYFLGYKLPEIPTAAATIQRACYDRINNRIIEGKSNFAELLTHDCHIIQIPRIESKIHNRLSRLLSFFEQAHFLDNEKMFKHYLLPLEGADEPVREMADLLYMISVDSEKRKSIEAEMEFRQIVAENTAATDIEKNKLLVQNAENKKALAASRKALADKDREIEELRRLLSDKK